MSDGLEITSMSLSKLPADEVTPDMTHGEIEWLMLEITVRNRSPSERYCVISDIRRIQHDDSTGALAVHLDDFPHERLRSPGHVCLDPGEETTLANRISSPITFIEEPPRGPRTARRARVPEDVSSIECIIAYGVEPPTAESPGLTVHASYKPPRS